RVAGAHLPPDPVMPAGFVRLVIEQRQQAGPNQRGFAASGASDHGDETEPVGQPVQRKDLVFPSEEVLMVIVGERTQARERMSGGCGRSFLRDAHGALGAATGTN